MTTKITLLDGHTMNPGDLSWSPIKQLGDVSIFAHTTADKIIERCSNASIIVTNKTPLTKETIAQLPLLECICVTATGINNIDLEAAKARNIPVYNVSGYSTHSVAQHVFAQIFSIQNKIYEHNQSVQKGEWSSSRDFCYTLSPISELAGKTLGIYGLGRIGQQVAQIGIAFGMQVLSTHKHPKRDAMSGVEFVDWKYLLQQSDYLTLHAPLSSQNAGIINKTALEQMKPTAILINTGRGGLINEADLSEALRQKVLFAAALDVLSTEPPSPSNPLLGIENCIITPHIAWASQEARARLMQETVINIQTFLNQKTLHSINKND